MKPKSNGSPKKRPAPPKDDADRDRPTIDEAVRTVLSRIEHGLEAKETH